MQSTSIMVVVQDAAKYMLRCTSEAMRLNADKKAQQNHGYRGKMSHFSDAHDPSGDSWSEMRSPLWTLR